MKTIIGAALLTAALLSACSGIPRRETQVESLARYMSYAGEPIHDFHTYSRFNSWSPVDGEHVLIETGVNEAYLLTVFPPCLNLPFATSIGLTSRFPHTISSGFDSVQIGNERCRIREIRPLNYRQLKADLKEEKQKERG